MILVWYKLNICKIELIELSEKKMDGHFGNTSICIDVESVIWIKNGKHLMLKSGFIEKNLNGFYNVPI